jgi:flagellar M-ring protein FliF
VPQLLLAGRRRLRVIGGEDDGRGLEVAHLDQRALRVQHQRLAQLHPVGLADLHRLLLGRHAFVDEQAGDAVLGDAHGPDGKKAYQPREQAELEKLGALVKSAIGFDEKRGDRVEIVNMRFARADDEPAVEEAGGLFGLGKNDFMRIGELAAFVVVAILAMLLVLRPMLARRGAAPAGAPALTAGAAPAQLPPPEGTALAALHGGEASPEHAQALGAPAGSAMALPRPEQMIDIAKIEGQVRASSVKKISELVSNHPEEAIAIMRTWMYQSN